MLTIYTSHNCISSKRAQKWLEQHGIAYVEKRIFVDDISENDIKSMLKFSENGFTDIISERSIVYSENKELIKDMKVKELIEFINEYPTILKRPIIVDETTELLLTGFNRFDIEELI